MIGKPATLLALLLGFALASSTASALPVSASAQLFAERTALLGGDATCHLLGAPARAALIATTGQARFGALRDGWTADALAGVAQRATEAGGKRICTDPLLLSSAKSAAAGYQGWAKMQAASFPGIERTWTARRIRDLSGWTLSQMLPGGAQFGVVTINDQKRLALALPESAATSASAVLYLRDRTRASKPYLDIPGVAMAPGLAAKAAPRSFTTARLASARTIDRPEKQPARVLFTFPDSVLAEMGALDPREAVEIELTQGATRTRYFVEIGDLAAARAFMAATPS